MYVCMYGYVCVRMYVCMYHTYTCMYVCNMCMYVCIIRVHVCIIRMYESYVCMYVCIYVSHICTCACVISDMQTCPTDRKQSSACFLMFQYKHTHVCCSILYTPLHMIRSISYVTREHIQTARKQSCSYFPHVVSSNIHTEP
jgi:hypothetical protein